VVSNVLKSMAGGFDNPDVSFTEYNEDFVAQIARVGGDLTL
jgi:hypothetical protein